MMSESPNSLASDDEVALSVVSPVYRAEKTVEPLVRRLDAALNGIGEKFAWEIILIDDGSPDGSWNAISEMCARQPHILGARLSRNFGQHHAIAAGLALARGRRVVVMDCDLQDRPEEIPALLAKAREGYEVVLARRVRRRDPLIKQLGSRLFYRLLSYLTGQWSDPAVANFGIYERSVIEVIKSMPESTRYFPTMVRWAGFGVATIDVTHDARADGKSRYAFGRLVRLAADIILANSEKPLRLTVKAGFIIAALGLGFAALTLVQALRGRFEVLGYASIMVSIWTLSGLIIFFMGVVGLYVGKILEEVKQRPQFVIREILNGPQK